MLPFEKNITTKIPNILSRFENPNEISEKLFSVHPQFEKEVWDYLTQKDIIGKSDLNSDKFSRLETIDFRNNHEIVTDRLSKIQAPREKFLLIWNAFFDAIIADFNTVEENWDNFFYPSSDDLYVISQDKKLVFYFAHYECLFIGYGLIDS